MKKHVALNVLRFIVTAFSIISLTIPSFGQVDSCTYSLEGRIVDMETGEPLPFANISIKESKIVAVSDLNGEFELENICNDEFDLIVSFIGYKTVLHHHDIYHKLPVIHMVKDQVLLEGVVIEGEYHGEHIRSSAIAELTKAEIQKSGAANLGELTSNISGVSMISTGQNVSKPVIHGLHSSRILIINNGIRHIFQNWGNEHAPEIDINAVERVEVIKGAATVKYGSSAMGGVILIDGNDPELHSDLKIDLKSNFKTNGKGGGVALGVAKGYDRLGLKFDLGGNILGDQQAPNYLLTNTSMKDLAFSGNVLYHEGKFQTEIFASRFYQQFGLLRGSVTESLLDLQQAMNSEIPLYTSEFDYIISTPHQKIKHDLLQVKSSYIYKEHSFTMNYAFQSNHRREFDVRRGTNNEIPSINLVLNSNQLDFEWILPEKERLESKFGLQTTYENNDNLPGTNTNSFVPNFNNFQTALFGIETFESGNNVFEAGARFDWFVTEIRGRNTDAVSTPYIHNYSMMNASGTLGWIYNTQNSFTSRVNIASSWRPPNIAELYVYGKHQSSIEYGLMHYTLDENNKVIGTTLTSNNNLDIQPEKGLKLIYSLEYEKKKTQAVLTAYLNQIYHYLYAKPAGITKTIRGAFPYFIYTRTNARFIGADMDVNLSQSTKLKHKLSLSFLYAETFDHKPLIEIPPPSVNYSIDWNTGMKPFDSFNFAVEPSYTFKPINYPRIITIDELISAETNGENIFQNNEEVFDIFPIPDGYFLLNAYARLAFKNIFLQFRCNNLLNVPYRVYTDRLRYFSDQTGRNFVITANIQI